ncbi:MAG: TlpA family protein disulfide reductase, partial [Fimbriiglobus sp.]
MRTLLAIALLFGLSACTQAEDKKPDEKPVEEPAPKKLGVGDPAPPLTVTKWLQGAEIKSFEPGKTYVVDFWATWCGPCISSMPHMDELATEYKDQGLTVVAVTSKDPNNSQEQVEKFVKDRGSKYAFGFAYCDTRAT